MYVLLRVFICVSSAYIASRLHSQHRVPLTWLFGAIALLYNPILPVKMARSDWEVINVFTAIIFIGFSVYLNWNTLLRRPGAPSIS
jgi:ABC-type glycerol-3-phosphate transport system permease component